MSLSFSASIGQEGKKELSFDVMASLSPLLCMLNTMAQTFFSTLQVAPEDTGLQESSCTGASTTHSSNSDASE